MRQDQAIDVLAQILKSGQLSNIQETIFIESWKGRTYQEIAKKTGYDSDYLKEVGSRLWQSLSNSLEVKVTKSNFKAILRNYVASVQQIKNTKNYATYYKNSLALSNTIIGANCNFQFGRDSETTELKNWILSDGIRLINVVGMVGIGKTTLVNKLAEEIKEEFNFIFYTRLLQSRKLKYVLLEFIKFTYHSNKNFSIQDYDTISLINKTVEIMSKNRCLLIFDGEFIDKKDYSYLLQKTSEIQHQSHLIIVTKRNIPYLARKNDKSSSIRSLFLSGLSCSDANKILIQQGLSSSLFLVTKYSGNPMFLEYAATTIKSLFGGDIEAFLAQNTFIYGEIYHLLEETISCLSLIEKQLVFYLASKNKAQSLNIIIQNISPEISSRELIENLESLYQRSLITMKQGDIILEPLIREYINLKENER